MTSKDTHLCIVARVLDCGCAVDAVRLTESAGLRDIRDWLNRVVTSNLYTEIQEHDDSWRLQVCPHRPLIDAKMPSAKAIRLADEIYKAIQVMRELA